MAGDGAETTRRTRKTASHEGKKKREFGEKRAGKVEKLRLLRAVLVVASVEGWKIVCETRANSYLNKYVLVSLL
jgi:hypothetical protein